MDLKNLLRPFGVKEEDFDSMAQRLEGAENNLKGIPELKIEIAKLSLDLQTIKRYLTAQCAITPIQEKES